MTSLNLCQITAASRRVLERQTLLFKALNSTEFQKWQTSHFAGYTRNRVFTIVRTLSAAKRFPRVSLNSAAPIKKDGGCI